MPRAKTKSRLAPRAGKQSFAESVEFPRWVLAVSVLWIGLTLLLGAIADPHGTLRRPGIGGYLYAGAVVVVAIMIARLDGKGRTARTLTSLLSRSRRESR